MKIRLLYTICTLLLTVTIANAQSKRANVWVFGDNYMLDFNSGKPIFVNGSQITNQEGCSSIADTNGSLLFYTNGKNIWCKNNQPMPNASFLDTNSDTQFSLIIPQPNNDNKLWLFKTDKYAGTIATTGVFYVEIDMNLNNGLGDVTKSKTLIADICSERLSAVKHKNNKDYWLIARSLNGNKWYVFLVDDTGISKSPISINLGGTYDNVMNNGIGALKISPSGNKIAANFQTTIEIFDFDNQTGVISNPIAIDVAPSVLEGLNSIEFSPDENCLYYTTLVTATLYQIDISSKNAVAIKNSKIQLATQSTGIQLAPDNKIYISDYNGLSVINKPNKLGLSCDLTPVTGLPKITTWTLPNFVSSFLKKLYIDLGTDTTFCQGDSAVFAVNNDYDTYLWHDGGTDTSFTAKTSGWVWLEVTKDGETTRDSVLVTVNPLPTINLGTDTAVCSGNSFMLDAGTGFTNYLWHDNSTSQKFTATTTGKCFVQITDNNGCKNADTINIDVNPLPTINLGNDTTVCSGNSVTLDAGAGFTTYLWHDNSTVQTIAVNNAGRFYVKITDNNGCENSDTINITVNPLPTINLGNDKTLCNIPSIELDAGVGFASYLWYDSSTGQKNTVSTSGKYYVQVTDTNGCVNSDTLTITFATMPVINLGRDTTICNGGSITLDAGAGFFSYKWNDNSTNQTLTVSSAGTYHVTASLLSGCTDQDTIQIIYATLPVLKLIADTAFCASQPLVVDAGSGFTSYLWSSGETTQSISVTQTDVYKATVTNACGSTTDSVSVTIHPVPGITGVNTDQPATLVVSVLGGTKPYQYSLDSLTTYQTNNTFINLDGGNYQVTVRDANGCVTQSYTVPVTAQGFVVPNFFTPNGDGTNDTWEIAGIKDYPDSDIMVFDRFSHLLANYKGSDVGWNGYYNGEPMPMDDYWYVVVQKPSGVIYKGHVTIKR